MLKRTFYLYDTQEDTAQFPDKKHFHFKLHLHINKYVILLAYHFTSKLLKTR